MENENEKSVPLDQKKWLTRKELEKYLDVKRSTIYLMIKQRNLPFTPMSKRSYRFERTKIDAWMAGREIGTVDEMIKKIA